MERFTRKDWPEGCPPDDAADADAIVYYVVKEDPCIPDDFLSQAERGRAMCGDSCCRGGLSVWTSEVDARHLAEVHPRLGTRQGVSVPREGGIAHRDIPCDLR